MSFFYLFIPTWIFTIILYTVLAGRYGAKEKYPEEEAKENLRNEQIEKYQEYKANTEEIVVKTSTPFSKLLRIISVTVLAISLILACIVLFGSDTKEVYINNREIFYKYTFVCTLIYFITAYWVLRLEKSSKS